MTDFIIGKYNPKLGAHETIIKYKGKKYTPEEYLKEIIELKKKGKNK